jgi:nucleoside-diphosphate-sugar epimerase
MKAIVTGATGGLGRNMVEYLLDKGYEVIAMGRNKKIGVMLNTTFKAFDLSNKAECEKYFENADIIYHCAALSSPWGEYKKFYDANIQATLNVIEMIKKFNIKKLVHISTPSIYFNYTDQYDIKEENIPDSFVNHYTSTKYEAEKLVLQSDIQSVIIRPRGIFGEYDSVLVPRLEKVAQRGFIPMIKGKEVTVDVTYVKNVVYAMYLAGTKEIPNKMIFNITNDEAQNLETLISNLMNSIGKPIIFKYKPYKLLDFVAKVFEFIGRIGLVKEPLVTRYGIGVISFSQTLDITKAKEVLGYSPIYTIKEGLENYAKWRNQTV